MPHAARASLAKSAVIIFDHEAQLAANTSSQLGGGPRWTHQPVGAVRETNRQSTEPATRRDFPTNVPSQGKSCQQPVQLQLRKPHPKMHLIVMATNVLNSFVAIRLERSQGRPPDFFGEVWGEEPTDGQVRDGLAFGDDGVFGGNPVLVNYACVVARVPFVKMAPVIKQLRWPLAVGRWPLAEAIRRYLEEPWLLADLWACP